jgi:hypothetical protein
LGPEPALSLSKELAMMVHWRHIEG